MKIILSRHGNTFEANTPATWVGCKNDLPLVSAGVEQARQLAYALKQAALPLHAVYCGPLQRTLHYAQIVLQELHSSLQPVVDVRLNELDYGGWSGLTNQQVIEKFGASEFENWEKFYKWPTQSGWEKSEAAVRTEALDFAADLLRKHKHDENVLVVSSNGKLRYFLHLIPGEYEQSIKNGTIKIKTGNVCELEFEKEWRVKYWNKTPIGEF